MPRMARVALALGAAALRAVAIGALSIGRARVRRLDIEDVEIGRLRVREVVPPAPGRNGEAAGGQGETGRSDVGGEHGH